MTNNTEAKAEAKAKIVCVTGSRDWTDNETILSVLRGLVKEGYGTLLHGGAAGADSMAARWASDLGMKVVCFPAEWEKWGKAAGPLRNSKMLKEGKPDLVIAFPTPDSVGTWDTVNKAKAQNIEVRVWEVKP